MARRTGKAATRRARQQRRTRQGPAPTPAAPTVPTSTDDDNQQPAAPRQPLFATVPTTSRLGDTAREEYHYVGRDLRNTAILSVIMAGLLAAAVALVNLAGSALS